MRRAARAGAAALLVAAHRDGGSFGTAVGAFLLAGALTAATGAAPALTRIVDRIPPALTGALLAGVLLSWIGDITLATFIVGLGFFLVAHLAYSAAFLASSRRRTSRWALLYVVWFVALLALLAASLIALPAAAQWKWRDKGGHVQYSDLPPPAGTPDQDILSRPSAPRRASITASAGTSRCDSSAARQAPIRASSLLAGITMERAGVLTCIRSIRDPAPGRRGAAGIRPRRCLRAIVPGR